jgi:hypothetical protein
LAISVLSERISREVLAQLLRDGFGDMVKFVVDVDRSLLAAGGELHADAEQLLLDREGVRRLAHELLGQGEAL